MKKLIVSLVCAILLFGGVFSVKAQSVQTLNEQYKAVLIQLIDVLKAQIIALQEQITVLLSNQINPIGIPTSKELIQPIQTATQNTQTFVENTPVTSSSIPIVIPEVVKLTLINTTSQPDLHLIAFVNPTSHNLKVNFIDLTTPLLRGTANVSIMFPDSIDTYEYTFGSASLSNYSARVPLTYDCSKCFRKGIDYWHLTTDRVNIVKPGESVRLRISLGVYSGEVVPVGKIVLNYVEGSITDAITGENILFNTTEFSN
jgi:hypothetical protein